MRQVNGEYTRAFNRRHGLTGHIFQGRFHSVLVDSDAYLIEVCRYVELNPVRAGMVRRVEQWPWCSYRANTGMTTRPAWLDTAEVLGQLLGRDVVTQADWHEARILYASTVASGLGVDLCGTHLRSGIYLGDDGFVARVKAHATPRRLQSPEISRTQRMSPLGLAAWLTPERSRDEAFRLAYSVGGLSMGEIARQAGMSMSSVSRMIASAERLQHSRPDTATFKT
jgi:hypothetical protein